AREAAEVHPDPGHDPPGAKTPYIYAASCKPLGDLCPISRQARPAALPPSLQLATPMSLFVVRGCVEVHGRNPAGGGSAQMTSLRPPTRTPVALRATAVRLVHLECVRAIRPHLCNTPTLTSNTTGHAVSYIQVCATHRELHATSATHGAHESSTRSRPH